MSTTSMGCGKNRVMNTQRVSRIELFPDSVTSDRSVQGTHEAISTVAENIRELALGLSSDHSNEPKDSVRQ